ncbi:MAG: DUF3566 domain-containing protein [Actinomycetota bacterium]
MSQTIEDQQNDAPQGSRPAKAARDAAPTAPVEATPSVTEAPVRADTAAYPDGPAESASASRGAARRRPFRPVRQGARRTRVVVRRVGPLSVLKFSLIFYFCVMLIVFFALAIIYAVLSAAGAMEEIGKLLGYFFGTGEAGTRDPEPIAINGGAVFTWLFIGGLVFTVVWSVINVFVAFLYNLISDIVGGIDVTLAEKPPR